MKDEQVFPIDDSDHFVCRLQSEHAKPLQRLFEQCADFALLVEGESVSPTAAKDIFQSVPKGKSLSDKFIYGLMDRQGAIVGVLEGIRHYPDEATWWVGLLLLAPEVRGHGLGRKIMEAFSEYVHANQGTAIMLGVVEENQAAYRFWQCLGYELVRQTGPRTFGRKTQRVSVMRRSLMEESESTKPSFAL